MSSNGIYFEYLNSISRKAKIYRKWVLKPEGKLLVGVPGRICTEIDPDYKVYYARESSQLLLQEYGFDELNSLEMPFNGVLGQLKSDCAYSTFSLAC